MEALLSMSKAGLWLEQQLCKRLPSTLWTLASDVQILHGRRVCRPKPLCEECSITGDCDYYRTVVSRERKGAAKPHRLHPPHPK